MKKITWILVALIIVLLLGVVVFVNQNANTNNNFVETVESIEYTIIDNKPVEQILNEYDYDPEDVIIENQGYLVIDKDGITGYIDSKGNKIPLD